MYNVLLVDDERIILEGISKIINWEDIGTILIGTAKNGVEAFDFIIKNRPHIVICDIKMPGLNGLELVKRISEQKLPTKFIILSGFGEFNYAKQAMEYGVKHYLVKPCNENSIVEALQHVKEEIKLEEKKDQYLVEMKGRLSQIQPYVKKQLLKEFITSMTDSSRGIDFYEKLLRINLQENKVRIILFRPEGDYDYEQMFIIENLGEDLFGSSTLTTNIGENILFLINELNLDDIQTKIIKLREHFYEIYKLDMTVAISEYDVIANARKLYIEALESLNHRFYLGEGTIITKHDINHEQHYQGFEYDGQSLCLLIKSGNWPKVEGEIQRFFNELSVRRLSSSLTTSYILQLFLLIIQSSDSKAIPEYMSKISSLMELETIKQMQAYFINVAKEITEVYFNRHKSNQSSVIHSMIDLVHNHIGNPELSLRWIANKVYMNPDYLGKLFKQETGDKFSSYVTQVRINKAIQQIEQMDDVKLFSIAEKIGFGDNPQYFSQVFKKYTGFSPSEYRKTI